MVGPKVQFKITDHNRFTSPGSDVEYSTETAHLFNPQYSSGQLIFIEDDGQIYLDFHNHRRCYSSEGGEDMKYAVKYLGISTTSPESGLVTIDGIQITPKINDMIAFQNKEFIYRKGENGHAKWFELGDEDMPGWDVDTQ